MMDEFGLARNGQLAALPRAECDPVAAPWPSSIIARRKAGADRLSERQFIRAYLSLFLRPAKADGCKTASLARFGEHEVRLIEFAVESCPDVPLLWVELYRHDRRTPLDSFRCDDLEDAVSAADTFIARAKALHENTGTAPRRKLTRAIVQVLREAGFACTLLGEADD